MNKEELINLISDKLSVKGPEEQLAFSIFVDKLSEMLNKNEAVRIKGTGVFQLKQFSIPKTDSNTGNKIFERKFSLIYSPMTEEFAQDSNTLFLKIDLPKLRISSDFDDSVFSIGINKPMIPFTENMSGNLDTETSYLLLRKSIEEKVEKILGETEKLENFDLWEDYINVKEPDAEESGLLEENESVNEEDESEFESSETSSTEYLKEEIKNLEAIEEEQDEIADLREQENHVDMLNEILSDDLDSILEDIDEDEPDENNNLVDEEKLTQEDIKSLITEEPESEGLNDTVTPEVDLLDDISFNDIEEKPEKKKIELPEEDSSSAGELVKQTVPVPPAEEEFGKIPVIKKRKFTFGKMLWFIIAGAVIVNAALVYFIFFSGNSSESEDENERIKKEQISESDKEASDGKPSEDLGKYSLSLNPQKSADEKIKQDSSLNPDDNLRNLNAPAENSEKTVNLKDIYQDLPEETRIPNTNIFYDGKRYNLQISSWKKMAIAETEVRKLREKGYNAFITKAYLEKFGGTWYRVKIGFFNSEKEASEYEKNLK